MGYENFHTHPRHGADKWLFGRVREWKTIWWMLRCQEFAFCWRLLKEPLVGPEGEKKGGSPQGHISQCGDHCGVASIDTALACGTAAAEAVLEDLP